MTDRTEEGSVRKLWPSDIPAFRDHLLRLDAHSRHQRFAMGASDDFVSGYAERSFSLDSVIHGYFEGDLLRGVGELRGIGRSRADAEGAFSVEAEWQANGVGSVLMEKTLLAARNRGIRRLYMNCLATNGAMQRLARRAGAELEYEAGDVVGLLLPSRASAASLLKEAVSDGYGWVTAVVDLQRKLIGAA